ncbi:MAG TPA: hypothetical protein VIX18_09250 [Nitrospirota bacterium]
MNSSLIVCLAWLISLSTLSLGCSESPPQYRPGGPYYYKSWINYYLPYRPAGEISLSEAEALERRGYAYCVAFFDTQGRIISFEKKYGSTVEFKVTYFYVNGVLRREGIIDANGLAKFTFYDEKGKRMHP